MLSELLSQLPSDTRDTIRGALASLKEDADGALGPIAELRTQYAASPKLDASIEHLESLQEQLAGLQMLFDTEVDPEHAEAESAVREADDAEAPASDAKNTAALPPTQGE